jgi:hypothetical protein
MGGIGKIPMCMVRFFFLGFNVIEIFLYLYSEF